MPVTCWAVALAHMNLWVTGGPGEIVGDIALDVHAEVGSCLVGMVILAVSLCENGVRREY